MPNFNFSMPDLAGGFVTINETIFRIADGVPGVPGLVWTMGASAGLGTSPSVSALAGANAATTTNSQGWLTSSQVTTDGWPMIDRRIHCR